MADLAARFDNNPIVKPGDVRPSRDGWEVTCVLNPGAFVHEGRTALLMRVAERPVPADGELVAVMLDAEAKDGVRVLRVREEDPDLGDHESRVFVYQGEPYLTTLSHLRLAWSDDGITFVPDETPTLEGAGEYETYGVEDCRVSRIDDRFVLTYTAVSDRGVAAGCISTEDWKAFTREGVMLPPHNKDVAIFEEQVGGRYICLHRPSGLGLGGNNIWIASSPDRVHWGEHKCLIRARPGMWDSERIGAGCAPIRTDKGWLEIYHGADDEGRYCLGALLLDTDDPTRVLARSDEPIMEPAAPYEQKGFYGNCIFTNGHVVDGDTIRLYYGASDLVICGATLSVDAILATLL